jgi:hypothetical protein
VGFSIQTFARTNQFVRTQVTNQLIEWGRIDPDSLIEKALIH